MPFGYKIGITRFLLEVTVQQTLQSLAVTGLVASHFMDGVVDGIQAVLLCADGQVGLALGCTELAVNAPCQIVLGGGLHALAARACGIVPAGRCSHKGGCRRKPNIHMWHFWMVPKEGRCHNFIHTFGGIFYGKADGFGCL